MKASYYNVYVRNGKKNTICFNTRLDSYCILTNEDAGLLKTDIAELKERAPKAYSSLVEAGMIADDDFDEYESLANEYRNAVESKHVYNLTILPSLDCNLRCWYCFEKHVKGSHLPEENAEAIYRFVERIFEEEPELSHLNVELFGGEPLLYFESELYPLLARIRDHVKAIGKSVSFFFVTNGVCINEGNIALFDDLKASFQISIDGFKDRHDEVKYMPETKAGTYDEMIRKVKMLTDKLEDVYINLRINYDDDTLPHMPELIDDLADVDRNKIGVHLERVWQTGGACNYENEQLKEVINMWMANGFDVSYMNMGRRSCSCLASARNKAVISCDGAVYKCSGRDFTPEHQDGRLNSDGRIEWDEERLSKRMPIKTYDNDMCRSCKFMPLCWGPCCQKQMESEGGDLGRYCQKQNMELSIADYVRYRFNNEYIKSKRE